VLRIRLRRLAGRSGHVIPTWGCADNYQGIQRLARCDGDEVCGLGADIVCIGGNHNELMACNPNIVLRAYFAGLQKELRLHAEPCQTGGRTAAPGMELVIEPQRA
jgi:hypothetical protein